MIDPWLIGTEARFRFVDIPGMPFHTPDPVKERIPMPLFDLPEPMTSVLSGVEYNMPNWSFPIWTMLLMPKALAILCEGFWRDEASMIILCLKMVKL